MKKPHRFRPGTVALREIRKFQKSVSTPLLNHLPHIWYKNKQWYLTFNFIDWIVNQKIAFLKINQRNRSRVQKWLEVPKSGSPRSSRGCRILSCRSFWGYQLVCYPRQESDHNAKGHTVGSQNKRRENMIRLILIYFWILKFFNHILYFLSILFSFILISSISHDHYWPMEFCQQILSSP